MTQSIAVTLVDVTGVHHLGWTRQAGGSWRPSDAQVSTWDVRNFISDPSGTRLVEELARRTHKFVSQLKGNPVAIGVSLPGTLTNTTTIERSTRLGILSPINLVEAFHAEGLNPSKLLHDTECLAIGEARYGALKDDPDIISGEEEFALVYADEGVGTTLFINGKPHNGAGCAGRIGRLVVAPDGPYNRTFACRGPLELFASRPSVSTNIVGEYLAEQGKSGESSAGDRAFRAAVGVAAQGDWSELSFEQIAQGVESRDPLAVTVIEEASQYLGLAIHSVLTVVHPPAIVLGGGMLERIPTFADSVTSHARRFSYPLAWNQTTIRLAKLGREAQGLGAAELLIRSLGHQNDRLEVVPH